MLEKNNLYSVNVPQGQGEEIRHSNVHPTNNNTDAEVKGAERANGSTDVMHVNLATNNGEDNNHAPSIAR